MRVWLDGQCLQTASRLRGIGRYVIELIRAISEFRSDIELVISFNGQMQPEAIDARDYVSQWVKGSNIHVWHGVADSSESLGGYSDRRQLSEAALLHHVTCLQVDIALSASPFEGAGDIAVPLLPASGSPFPIAAMFYDAIPLRFPDQYLPTKLSRTFYRRRLARLSHSAINLCISSFSASESRDLLPNVPTANIMAGVSPDLLGYLSKPDADGPALSRNPFALYVGGLDWRKNVGLIVDAFAKFDRPLQEASALVLAGDHPTPLLQSLRSSWNDQGLPDKNLIFLGHLTDEKLVGVYRQARVVVQPSLMEGFGLTALEAIVAGVPVVVAKAGALPEIVGDDEATFNPRDSAALSKLIAPLLRDPKHSVELARKQKSRAAAFSWRISADTAATALIAAATKARRVTSFSLEQTRKSSLATYRGRTLPSKLVAAAFSGAEPIPRSPKRLIVEATQTAKIDAGTGIQRVVKLITNNLLASARYDVADRSVVACLEGDEWYQVDRGDGAQLRIPEVTRRVYERFRPNDTILMLDSSWEFHSVHQRSLMSARMRGADVVSCLYDVVPLLAPAFCDPGMPAVFSGWFQAALRRSSGFVCISKAVADELLSLLSAIDFPRSMKVGYWRLGADFAPVAHRISDGGPSARRPVTFLMVGTLEPRKGHIIALRAMEALWEAGCDARLIIAGRRGWGVDHLVSLLMSHKEFGQRLIWREGVGDIELRKLYDESDALIAASFGEGFGLPIVEAGRFRKSVIASDLPVFREVSAGSPNALFFQVGDSHSLHEQLATFIRLHQERKELPGGYTPEVSWPSWQESAAELEDVLLGGKWYATYEPKGSALVDDASSIGLVEMVNEVPEGRQKFELTVIGPPEPSRQGGVSFLVRLKNLSPMTWSSAATDDRYSFKVGGIVSDGLGAVLNYGPITTRLPFVLPPGATCFLKLEVSRDMIRRGAATIDFAVGQGQTWWSGRTSVAIPSVRSLR